MREKAGIKGFVHIQLFDKDGNLKTERKIENLVTTAGDQYYAKMIAAGVSPANAVAPTKASGMKLGTGSTAATKSGAAAALGAYILGSNNPYDASYPQTASNGGDTGWNVVYQTTWGAGDVTNAAITEVVLVNDGGTDGSSTAANTYARATFTAVDKTATDSLIITWTHTLLGA